jgi:acyl-coenzyme A synthetase/AMP-(fatty) acid ligase/acyl carrier protein
MLATLKTGRYYVPLNPANSVEANRRILLDADARLLLTDSGHATLAKNTAATVCQIEEIDHFDGAALTMSESPVISPGDLAGLFYTSGTTGKPKGVMQTQRSFLHAAYSFINAMHIGPEDRLMLGYHGSTGASVKNIFAGLLTGATLCPWDFSQQGAAAMANWLNTQRITALYMFSSAFGQCMSAVPPDVKFPQVRALTLSSEPVYDSDVTTSRDRFPAANTFINQLASTEAGAYRRYVIDRAVSVRPGILPLGHKVEDKDVLLCDEQGDLVGSGEIGEIVVKSRYIALGYWKQPELSESVFSAPDGPDGERLFRTGDLGRMDADGCLHSLGRKDGQVKIRGRRVEIASVEAALVGLEPIEQTAVVARDDENGQTQLVAFFVSADNTLSTSTLRRQLTEVLSTAEVPALFKRLQALPRLPNGKIDRKALASREIAREATPFVGPRDAVEENLAAALRRLLRVDRLGIDDDIFEHGADSLTAVEIVAVIEQEFGVDVPMEALWSGAHTIAAMAQLIRLAGDEPQSFDASLAIPAGDTAPTNARPAFYTIPRRLFTPKDIAELALLPAAKLIATMVPESHWRRTADLFGLLRAVLRPRQVRALGHEIERQCDGAACGTDGLAILRGIRAGGLERRLRMLTSPAKWETPLVLQGQRHIDLGLSRGRGVMLWLSPATFTGLVGHQAVHQAGYPVNMLSRPEHGLSTTVFGQCFLNRFVYRGGEPGHAQRIVIIDDGQAAIETMRRRLRENHIVAIAAVAHADHPFHCRFLDGEIELASGPPRLALATGAALLPVFARRHVDGFQVLVGPALEPDDTAQDTAIESLVKQFVEQSERFVRRHPTETSHWASLR